MVEQGWPACCIRYTVQCLSASHAQLVATLLRPWLQDKAENGLLGRSVARTLNIGLMLASVGHLLVFGPILNQASPMKETVKTAHEHAKQRYSIWLHSTALPCTACGGCCNNATVLPSILFGRSITLPSLICCPLGWPQGHGGWLLPILTATWGTALLASMAGLAAPEVTHLLEQAEAEAAATAASE